MYRAFNKLLRARLKFLLLFIQYFLRHSSFRNNLFLDRRLFDLDATSKRVKSLLKLNPAWAKGHLLLGLCSYESFLSTKDQYYLGVLDLSASALDQIKYDVTAIGILRLCVDFLTKDYAKINAISIEKELSKDDFWATTYLDILRLELIGSSLLAEDKRALAKQVFLKIHPERRSQEVRVAFMMFDAIPT